MGNTGRSSNRVRLEEYSRLYCRFTTMALGSSLQMVSDSPCTVMALPGELQASTPCQTAIPPAVAPHYGFLQYMPVQSMICISARIPFFSLKSSTASLHAHMAP
jgi:hypothetical protein